MSNRDDDFDDEEIDANGRWVGGAILLGAIALIVIALLV